MANPYHVRLAISQYGEQFRAELFTEDLGDTEGDLLPGTWDVLNDDFMSYLVMGAASLPPDSARKAGQELFQHLLGNDENSKKWIEILDRAKRQPEHFAEYCQATGSALQSALQAGEFDILHLLAHGFAEGVILCDAAGGRSEVTGESRILALAFSPDLQFVVSGDRHGNAQVWDLATGEPAGKPLTHSGAIVAVAFSPDGKLIATGCDDGVARLWDGETATVMESTPPKEETVSAVAFSPDGKLIATGSDDGVARLWDGETATQLASTPKQEETVSAVSFSPDGQTLFTGYMNKVARMWEVPLPEPSEVPELKSIGDPMRHTGPVLVGIFSQDGKNIFTGSGDGKVDRWDAVSGKSLATLGQHDHRVLSIAVSPQMQTVVSGSRDHIVRLWDVQTDADCNILPHESIVDMAAYSPDSLTVATASEDRTARLWDTATGNPRMDALQHQDDVNVVRFSPNGQLVATASNDQTAQLWDAATGQRHGPPLRHEGEVVDVAFSGDGKMLATASWDGSARLWDVATGLPTVPPLFHNGPRVVWVSFSPDARTLVSGSWDGTARLWDTQTGLLRGGPLRHDTRVYLVAFNPDGRSIATTTNEKLVRLWDYVPIAEDDAQRIRLWIHVWTGQGWNDQDDLTPLTFPQWLSDKKQLDQLGGPPIPSAGPASGSPSH